MKKYLITSRVFYTDTPAVFRSILHESFQIFSPDFALYRDKTNPSYDKQAAHFVEVCNQFENIKSFIHQNIELSKELNANGVHLTSKQFDLIKKAKDMNLEVCISTHTFEDIKKAEDSGADYVTFSPIFSTPNKGKPLGVKKLKDAVNSFDINIFALGGIISDREVDLIAKANPFGFASIRYFYN